MGIPVEPIEYGFDCTACLSCFPPGKTPKYVTARFSNIIKCGPGPLPEPPNNQNFILTQTGIYAPCEWSNYKHGETPEWKVYYYAGWGGDDRSVLGMGYTPMPCPVFNAYTEEQCATGFPWNFIYCPDNFYGEGMGVVSFTADPAPEILTETMGFHPGINNLYEKTPTIADLADYRIANKLDKTNILCRVCTAIIGRENEILEFTGDLDPDATGDFVEVCTYNGQPFYHNAGEGWFLWYDSINEIWVVSILLGITGSAYWTSTDKISNSYIAHGTASGVGDMHASA